jgi:transposase
MSDRLAAARRATEERNAERARVIQALEREGHNDRFIAGYLGVTMRTVGRYRRRRREAAQ